MSDTLQRDQVAALAKLQPAQALSKARGIQDPWFRSQAFAWLARFSPKDAAKFAREASRAAHECGDAYQRVAVRAWQVAALAEIGHGTEAKKALATAVQESVDIIPVSSKAEALFLLLQAAARIGTKEREFVHDALQNTCAADGHWRSKRALRNAELIREGKLEPRQFFW